MRLLTHCANRLIKEERQYGPIVACATGGQGVGIYPKKKKKKPLHLYHDVFISFPALLCAVFIALRHIYRATTAVVAAPTPKRPRSEVALYYMTTSFCQSPTFQTRITFFRSH